MGWVVNATVALPRGKTRYLLYRRLSWPQGRSGRVWKISPQLGFDPRTVQSRSESLYRLSYRGPHNIRNVCCMYMCLLRHVSANCSSLHQAVSQ